MTTVNTHINFVNRALAVVSTRGLGMVLGDVLLQAGKSDMDRLY